MPQIITQIANKMHISWQKELANVVTDPADLLKLLDFDANNYRDDIKARRLFPMRVPRPFINRMAKGDWQDPLFQQVMTLKEEYRQSPGYSNDPLEEQDGPVAGILHKYKSRVLLILKGGCAVNCRYCFRRHFPYGDNSMNRKGLVEALNYIRQDSNINEVILSGGDPLMEKDERLQWLFSELNAITTVKRLRIHTRLPVVIPSRVTQQFLSAIGSLNIPCVMVLHINHANEIDSEVASAMKMLKNSGVHLLNQTVLLKGVNDSVETLSALSEKLFSVGILPYYLHLLDKVTGAAHFDIDEAIAIQLMKQLLLELPGFLVPKLVREIAGEGSKTPIDLKLLG